MENVMLWLQTSARPRPMRVHRIINNGRNTLARGRLLDEADARGAGLDEAIVSHALGESRRNAM